MILQILLFMFSLLLTPYGMFAVLFGLMLFFMLPVIPRVTGEFKTFAHLHLWLCANQLKRAAIVLSEHGDLLLKRMSPEDIGTESITFQNSKKEFEDPDQAKSQWAGIPFAFADEIHGFLFSIRDAGLGRRKKEAEEHDEMVIKATAQENKMYEVNGWVRGVFEFPAKATEFVNLNHVRQLVTGSERAEDPQRIETYYEHSREPYKQGKSAAKYIMLILSIIGPFAAIWLLATQLQTGGGGGGSTPDTTVSLFLLALAPLARINPKKVLIGLIVLAPLPLVFLLVFLFVSPITAIALFLLIGIGFWMVPIFMFLLRPVTGLSTKVARLYAKLGLFAFKEPVWVETPTKYELREYDAIEETANVTWHSFLGRKVGFGFESTEDSWDTEVADPQEVKNTMITDGGAKTNIPSGYSVIPEKQRAVYGIFVPSKLSKKSYYLWTGIALERYAHVATGHKTHNRLEKSKEEHGGMDSLNDKTMIIAMAVLGTISLMAGIGVFFLA